MHIREIPMTTTPAATMPTGPHPARVSYQGIPDFERTAAVCRSTGGSSPVPPVCGHNEPEILPLAINLRQTESTAAQVSQGLSKLRVGAVPPPEIPRSILNHLIQRSHGLYDIDFLEGLYDGMLLLLLPLLGSIFD